MASNSYSISGYQVSQNIQNNTSYVYVYGTLTTDGNTFNGYNTAYYNFTAIQGSQSFATGNIYFSVGKNNTKTFSATLGPFQHNADGSLGNVTVTSRCYVVPGYSSTDFNRTASISMGTIPRASSIPDVSGNIGSTITIPIDRKSSGFTTTLTYSFGSLSGTIVSKTSSISPTWTIPNTFYAQIPNAKSGTGTITCTTYNGNTQIGDSVSRTLTANAVEVDVNPTVSITSVVETDTKLIAKIGSGGAYINGYSKPKVTFSASARQSASLSSLMINGISVPTNTTTYTINNINTNTITIVATDTRGYSSTGTSTLTPFDNYQSPNATFTTLKRNTPTNGQIDITYNGSWYNGNFDTSGGTQANSLSVDLDYKESGSSTWINYGTLTPTISENNFSQSITIGDDGSITGLFDYTKSWDIKLTLKDYLCDGSSGYEAIIVTGSVTKGKPTFWWDDDLHVEGDLYLQGINISNIMDILHPVGEVYITTSSTFNPNTSFGGTWVQLTGNEYLRIMSGNMSQTGGSYSITEANLPSHSHTMSHTHNFAADFYIRHGTSAGTDTVAGGTNTTITTGAYSDTWGNGFNTSTYSHHPDKVAINGSTGGSSSSKTGSTGSGTDFVLRYYGVYAWRRTS